MKKLLFVILALLLTCGSAFAANIPMVVDPSAGPEVWTQEVYNDSGSELTSGTTVVWDYTDTDMYYLANRKMYVTTTTTADDVSTAGVIVDTSIKNGDVGTIAIYGPVKALTASNGSATTGHLVGTSTTAGKCTTHADTGADDAILGWSVNSSTAGQEGGGANLAVVFVNVCLAN